MVRPECQRGLAARSRRRSLRGAESPAPCRRGGSCWKPSTDWRDWITHETGDPWWDKFPFFDDTSRPDVPALFVNSWYDTDVGDTAKLFNMFKKQSTSEKSRRNQFLIISPTAHCQSEQGCTPHIVGERDVGDIRRDYWSIYLSWFNHWLRDGDHNGDYKMPHVQ
ncbi:CocE/NonD family hydrolase [Mesorhizobium sp. M1216]|uniref:CocE/NonD family hydrolase n=1 Tax=Mesorhizobium sp. M1216 TaxID=2957069 RepID=UPI00333CAC35